MGSVLLCALALLGISSFLIDQCNCDNAPSTDSSKDNSDDNDRTPNEEDRKACMNNNKDLDVLGVSTYKDQPCKVTCNYEDSQVTINLSKNTACTKDNKDGKCTEDGKCL